MNLTQLTGASIVVDVLNSVSTENSLSANQGKILKDGLDTKPTMVSGLVQAINLPSYVDDVLEYADLASFPVSGEGSKIYIAIDTNTQYRWTGTVYVTIIASPGTTSNVVEGSNLYFTEARVRNTVLTGLSVSPSTVIVNTDSILLATGKLQAQITTISSSLSNYALTSALSSYATIVNDRYTINSQTGATYTIVAGDVTSNGRVIVKCTYATAITVTIATPTSLGVSVGDSVNIRQGGAGAITLSGTISGNLTTNTLYETFTLVAETTTSWLRVGG